MKRAKFLNQLVTLDPSKLVYVDESGIDTFISREYAWSQRGLQVAGEISGKRYARESFIAGQLQNKIVSPFCYTGTCDSKLFNYWLEHYLLPNLGPGHIIILDNAAFHKSEKTKNLIEDAGCQILFLPPYSPDLNPIEKFWANLKTKIKKIIGKFQSLADAINSAFRSDHLFFN